MLSLFKNYLRPGNAIENETSILLLSDALVDENIMLIGKMIQSIHRYLIEIKN
jgi:hypothetical protein